MVSLVKCRTDSCRVLAAVQTKVPSILDQWETHKRVFVGVDVSTVYTGVAALGIENRRAVCLASSVINMKRPKVQANVVNRLQLLRQGLTEFRGHLTSKGFLNPPCSVTIEDKVVRSGGSRGIHAMTEVIVLAQVAGHEAFGCECPDLINARTAREGLGLNKLDSDRATAKQGVRAFVDANFPSQVPFEGLKRDEDRADAVIVALGGLRGGIRSSLAQDSEIQQLFAACHASWSADDKDKKLRGWINQVWLSTQFSLATN